MARVSPDIEEYRIRANYAELDEARPGLVTELGDFVHRVYPNLSTEELHEMLSMRQVLVARRDGAQGNVVGVTTTDVNNPAEAYNEPKLPKNRNGLYLGLAAISPDEDQRLYERLTIKRFAIARASVMPCMFTKTNSWDEFSRINALIGEFDDYHKVIAVTKLSQFVIAPEFHVVENPPNQATFNGANDVVSVWDIEHR